LATAIHPISLKTSVPHTRSEGSESNPFLCRMTDEYEDFTSFPLLPNKVIANLLGWAEKLKLPDSLLTSIGDRRQAIKGVSSAFETPEYFTKHVKLYKACNDLKNRLTQEVPPKTEKVVEDVKKVFIASLSSLSSILKIPQALSESKIIDLNKISRVLPSVLSKTECVVSLASSTISLIDTTLTLRDEVKKVNLPLAQQIRHPSIKIKRTCLTLVTNSLSIVSKCISAASLFLGFYTSPYVTMSLSTASLVASLGGKIAKNSNLFGLKKSKYSLEASVSLPA
jgi:hypothetical protein